MGVFCTLVQIPMLTMFHLRQDLALSGFIALEFISDDQVVLSR